MSLQEVDVAQLYEDGVWIDEKTGLMWARFSLGQQWSKGKAIGEAETFTFATAKEAAANVSLADFKDWRVPTLDELKTLMRDRKKVGYECPKSALLQPIKGVWGWYWSSSGGKDYAHLVAFSNGAACFGFADQGHYVRVVRTFG